MTLEEKAAEELKKTNREFYKAFESLSIEAMAEVWAHSDRVKCIHPGWELLMGWPAVQDSWEVIFNNANYMQFTITDVDVAVVGNWGWVTCLENIVSVVGGHVTEGKVQATNIFVRDGGRWKMVHHHGSPVLRTSSSTQ